MKKLKNKAFTLVELIVVITILAILGTIAFISFQSYSSNARDGVRIADLNSIKKNLELFITEKGFYPTPDNGTNITYIGATAWTQGTVGNNVITNLARLNKKPTDPLTNSEYTYSITNAKTEYQLASISEGGLSYNIPLTNQTYAATTKTAIAKVVGTYNEKLLKVSTGGIDYILATPSIINTNLSITDLPSIITNKQLVYNNYQNLPDSYKNTGYTMTGGFDFAPPSNNIVVYSGSLANLTSSGTIQQQFITKLQSIYNGTILQSEPTIKEILNATNTIQQQTLVGSYITNHIGGITGINTVETNTIPQTYTVTFDGNGGTLGSPTSKIVTYNTAVGTLPPNPTKIGSTFNGWFTELIGGTQITESTVITTNITYYAQWSVDFICGNSITINVSGTDYTYTTKFGPDLRCWTATNMKHTPTVGISRCYDNNSANCNSYGRLYDWTAANDNSVCGLLGAGWILPTDAQWTTLTSAGATGRLGTRLSGIISKLGGGHYTSGAFAGIDTHGYRWTSSLVSGTNYIYRYLDSGSYSVIIDNISKDYGFNVICIKN